MPLYRVHRVTVWRWGFRKLRALEDKAEKVLKCSSTEILSSLRKQPATNADQTFRKTEGTLSGLSQVSHRATPPWHEIGTLWDRKQVFLYTSHVLTSLPSPHLHTSCD